MKKTQLLIFIKIFILSSNPFLLILVDGKTNANFYFKFQSLSFDLGGWNNANFLFQRCYYNG